MDIDVVEALQALGLDDPDLIRCLDETGAQTIADAAGFIVCEWVRLFDMNE